jgi:5-methylcytosine-specific restriction endonuclease McrA
MIYANCKRCGKEKAYKYKSFVRDFCSHSCANYGKAGDGKSVEITCSVCGIKKSYSKAEASQRTGNYCSRLCANKDIHLKAESRHEIECFVCNKTFSTYKSRVNKKFCSNRCRQQSRRKKGAWSTTDQDVQKRRLYFRNYYISNIDRLRKLKSEWAKRNRTYRNYLQAMRRAAGTLKRSEWEEIIQNSTCCKMCGATERLEVDHIKPISAGGRTEVGNLQVLCRSCNASKGGVNRIKRKLMKQLGHEINEV